MLRTWWDLIPWTRHHLFWKHILQFSLWISFTWMKSVDWTASIVPRVFTFSYLHCSHSLMLELSHFNPVTTQFSAVQRASLLKKPTDASSLHFTSIQCLLLSFHRGQWRRRLKTRRQTQGKDMSPDKMGMWKRKDREKQKTKQTRPGMSH